MTPTLARQGGTENAVDYLIRELTDLRNRQNRAEQLIRAIPQGNVTLVSSPMQNLDGAAAWFLVTQATAIPAGTAASPGSGTGTRYKRDYSTTPPRWVSAGFPDETLVNIHVKTWKNSYFAFCIYTQGSWEIVDINDCLGLG